MENKTKRPLIITVICVISFIGSLVLLPVIFSSSAKSIGSWYPPYLAVSIVIGLACMIGLWMMKRWSIIAYTIFFILNQAISIILIGNWNLFGIIIPAIVIGIIFSKYSEMN